MLEMDNSVQPILAAKNAEVSSSEQGVPEKMAQCLRHNISATVRHRVMQFSRKCPEIIAYTIKSNV